MGESCKVATGNKWSSQFLSAKVIRIYREEVFLHCNPGELFPCPALGTAFTTWKNWTKNNFSRVKQAPLLPGPSANPCLIQHVSLYQNIFVSLVYLRKSDVHQLVFFALRSRFCFIVTLSTWGSIFIAFLLQHFDITWASLRCKCSS